MSIDPSNTLDNKNPVSKHRRTITTNEEKEMLNPLLLKDSMLTEAEINDALKNLSSAWNIQRVKRYIIIIK